MELVKLFLTLIEFEKCATRVGAGGKNLDLLEANCELQIMWFDGKITCQIIKTKDKKERRVSSFDSTVGFIYTRKLANVLSNLFRLCHNFLSDTFAGSQKKWKKIKRITHKSTTDITTTKCAFYLEYCQNGMVKSKYIKIK